MPRTKLTEEHKSRISKSMKKKCNSSEMRKKYKKRDWSNYKGGGFKNKKHSNETKQKISESVRRDKSPHWLGGISKKVEYSVDWTITLRMAIRERDKYTCQICGKKQGDRAFSVHHIDYDKNNCSQENLVTLCNSCHSKTNKNREQWIKYFLIQGYISLKR